MAFCFGSMGPGIVILRMFHSGYPNVSSGELYMTVF